MPSVTRSQYAGLVLAPPYTDTPEHRQALVAVMAGENSQAVWNPMDTEESEPGAWNYNSAGVQDYPTVTEGVAATRSTLAGGYYPQLDALLSNPASTAAQIVSCPEWAVWGTFPSGSQGLAQLRAIQPTWPAPGEALVAGSSGPPLAPPPPPIPQEVPQMYCTDPATGKVIATDPDGNFYADAGIPGIGICTLPEHPAWQAGQAESGGSNPCIGITPWLDPTGAWGYCYITKPASGSGSFGPYDSYHIRRDGTPD